MEYFDDDIRASNGNIIGLACGPLSRPRYINDKIEVELLEFKREIEERFAKSDVNAKFVFPLMQQQLHAKSPQTSTKHGNSKTFDFPPVLLSYL
ncbi:hypothetical protein COB52_04875 [Candidatus Kaiserbacteria bacterium]|nr:MAG: hypothetical protein COB52_04875 [Candidatus Kaiserbacteria bacterium]